MMSPEEQIFDQDQSASLQPTDKKTRKKERARQFEQERHGTSSHKQTSRLQEGQKIAFKPRGIRRRG